MNTKGMALIEIVVSMLILSVCALAVTATISIVNSGQMHRSAGTITGGVFAGGGSLDLQALSFARETLESLKNNVSTDATRGAPLVVGTYDTTATLPAAFRNAPVNGTRTYTVSNLGGGTDLKKVTVTVLWTDTI